MTNDGDTPATAPPAEAPLRSGRWGCAVLLLGLAAAVAIVFVLGSPAWLVSIAPVAGIVVGGVLLARRAVDSMAPWAGEPLLPAATAFGAAAFALLVAAIVRDALGLEIVLLRPAPAWRDALRGIPPSFGRALLFVVAAHFVVTLGSALGRVVARRLRRDVLVRGLRSAALATVAACAALFVAAGIRAVGSEDVDAEMRLLRGVTRALSAPGSEAPGRGSLEPPEEPSQVREQLGPNGIYQTPFLDVVIVQDCVRAGCRVSVIDPSSAAPDRAAEAGAFQAWDETLLVTRDRAAGKVYLRDREDGMPRSELRHEDGRWVPAGFDPRPIARRLSAPRELLVLSAVCLVLAAALLVRARTAANDEAKLRSATEGVLGDDGWILLPGGATARCDAASMPSPGPVVVFGERAQGTAYRDRPLVRGDVLPGTVAENRERLQLVRVYSYSGVLAAALLGAAPLAAAVPAGLVLPIGGLDALPLRADPPPPPSPSN
ncbi:MAG: hypothetical protein U0441_31655 [Polyangiaceae bacterium]